MSESLFIRLLADDDKETALINAIASLHNSSPTNSKIYTVNPNSFRQVPCSPFAYWVSDRIRQLFTKLPPLESEGRIVRSGISTSDDFRFLRVWWEGSPEETVTGMTETTPEEFCQQTFKGKRWIPFAKGGEYSPYYADLHLVINWEQEGDDIRSFDRAFIRNENFYFRSGLTWTLRTQLSFNMRFLPSGAIFSHKGPGAFVNKLDLPLYLGLSNSSVFGVSG